MEDKPTRTLAYAERSQRSAALDETLAAPATPLADPRARSLVATAAVRSTVLPRIERSEGAERVVLAERPRYEEVRPLGAGGQAEVTLTRDLDIDRVVAVKRLLPENDDHASVLRFAEEVRTVGRLEHPNIVPIHDVGVDAEGRYFFVMKYVEGETLESIIGKLQAGDPAYLARYTPEYRLQICNEILRGVEHAHALGILHRDLKPANVMVGPLGEVVVMDWGLAKQAGEPEPGPDAPRAAGDERARLFETHTGSLLGTPAYMSPEQAVGMPLDVRSDVYSLAVMFYEFLCLRHPRRHLTTVTEMIASLVAEPVGTLRILDDFGRARAPAALAHFVRHGLAHDVARRYPTVKAMRERLEAVRDGRAPIECHLTFTKRVLSGISRSVDRHPLVLLAFYALGTAAPLWLLLR